MAKKRILVLCIDRDNDLFEKAKVAGPVVGRDANIEAATKLALADPEEPDANTIFEAVKIYDELSKENKVTVATLTGSARLGYTADREVSKQLDRLLEEFKAESCVFISDGANDEQVIPIIQSRIRIDSIKLVVMKQAKELEKFYIVLAEKLKEPHYARMFFGIPGVILLLLAAGYLLGLDWRPLALIAGGYFIAKGFGLEEYVLNYASSFRFSFEKLSFILYLAAIPLLLVSLAQAYAGYVSYSALTTDSLKIIAYAVTRLLLLLPWVFTLVIAGKILDLLHENRRYEISRYGMYLISVFVLWLIFDIASKWVLAEVYFSELVFTIIASIVLTILAMRIMDKIKLRIASGMKLESKEVLTDLGAYIGKTIGVDRKRGLFIVQTPMGQKLDFNMEKIVGIGDKVVIRH